MRKIRLLLAVRRSYTTTRLRLTLAELQKLNSQRCFGQPFKYVTLLSDTCVWYHCCKGQVSSDLRCHFGRRAVAAPALLVASVSVPSCADVVVAAAVSPVAGRCLFQPDIQCVRYSSVSPSCLALSYRCVGVPPSYSAPWALGAAVRCVPVIRAASSAVV